MNKKDSLLSASGITKLALLFAVIVLLTLFPVRVGTIEMSLCMIPVVLGGIIMGPVAGAVLGFFFGLCSFLQCFGILSPSPFGAFVLELNPLYTAIMCFVPRIIMGFLSALLFKTLNKRDKTNFVSYLLANLSGALLNTVLFMGTLLLLFFGNEGFISQMNSWGLNTDSVGIFLVAFVGINGVVEAIVCSTLGTAVSKGVHAALNKIHKIK